MWRQFKRFAYFGQHFHRWLCVAALDIGDVVLRGPDHGCKLNLGHSRLSAIVLDVSSHEVEQLRRLHSHAPEYRLRDHIMSSLNGWD